MKKNLSSSIALIYSYLVCLMTILWILVNGGMVIDRAVRFTAFENTYSPPHHLRYTYFHEEAQKNKEGEVKPLYNKELKEKERKNRIEEDKAEARKQHLSNLYQHLSYLLFPVIFLITHAFLALKIRRNQSE